MSPERVPPGDERDAADRALLVLVVAHVEPLVLARREPRRPERAVAAGAHGALALHAADEGPEHVLAAARRAVTRRALDRARPPRPPRGPRASRRGRAGRPASRPARRRRVTVRDHGTKRSSSAESAVRLGRQARASRSGRPAPERARNSPPWPRATSADAGEGLAVCGVHHPPGERRGRGEGDRDGLGGAAGPATTAARPRSPAVGHERARPRAARRRAGSVPSGRVSTQRVVCVRPSKRTRAPAAGVRRSASVTVPRRTWPSASVTGRASAPARTGCLSCVANAGASTRSRFPSLGRAPRSGTSRRPSSPSTAAGRRRGVASCGRRPPPGHSVTVAPTTGPPRSSTTRPARARALGSRTSPASSPPESKSAASTRGAAVPPRSASRTGGAGRSGHRDGEGPVGPAHGAGQRPSAGPRGAPRAGRRRSRPRTAGRPRRRRRPACRPRAPGRGSHRRAAVAGERDEDGGGRQEAEGHGGSPGGAKVRRPLDAVEGAKVGSSTMADPSSTGQRGAPRGDRVGAPSVQSARSRG